MSWANGVVRLRSSRLLPAVLLLMAALGTMLVRGCGDHPAPGLTPVRQRGAPRELTFVLLDGREWRLSGQRGNVVAVNLWATWCAPCRAEIPLFVRMGHEMSGPGFRTVGIALDSTRDRLDRVRSFGAMYKVDYPLGFPPPLSQMQAGLDGIPTTLLFDREGRAAKIYVGEIDERAFRADVSDLLRESGDAGQVRSGR